MPPAADDLKYPIGPFAPPDTLTPEQVNTWIDEIAALPAALRRAVTPLTESQLDTPYRPGGWTVRQVVHHVPDSHLNSLIRFKWTLTEDRPTIKAYDEKSWATLPDYAAVPIAHSLDLLETLHVRLGGVAPESLLEPTAARVRPSRVGAGVAGGDGRRIRLAWPASPGSHRAADRTRGLEVSTARPTTRDQPLRNQVAVVAGATRGAGRGIARMLGAASATVYCTGRSVRGKPATATRPETIEETAELVTADGGRGIAVQVDHTVESQVEALFTRVQTEQSRLDVLVNDIWGGDDLMEWSAPFWTLSTRKGLTMLERAVHTHIITSRYGVPLMVERNSGLIVEITYGDTLGYRGSLFYDLAKSSVIRLGYALASELHAHRVTALTVTPAFLRSEAVLDQLGVTEERWRDAVAQDPYFAESETPCYIGRAVAALAAGPGVSSKSGGVFASWTLAKEYGFTDLDGRQPDWGSFFPRKVQEIIDRDTPTGPMDLFAVRIRFHQVERDPSAADEAQRLRAFLDRHRRPPPTVPARHDRQRGTAGGRARYSTGAGARVRSGKRGRPGRS